MTGPSSAFGAALRVLLVQIRDPDDPMLAHEMLCVQSRLGGRQVELFGRNALAEAAEPDWLAGIDVLMIGGSGDYSVHHSRSRPWVDPLRHLLDAALERQMPGMGICFGHQLLGMHLGTDVRTDPRNAEIGTVDVEVTATGRRAPLLRGWGDGFAVHTGHSDHVDGVPPGVDLLARNGATESQMFHVRGTHFYSTQFHPDLSGQEARDRFLAYKQVLDDGSPSPAAEKALRFTPGRDESNRLIGGLIDLLMTDPDG